MALFNTKMSKIKFDKFIKKLSTVIEAEQRNMQICHGDYSILLLILAKVTGTTPSLSRIFFVQPKVMPIKV